jgi:hypothetical protein
MPKNLKCMNKYQKAAHRPGERRVSHEEIEHLIELSRSDDPQDRETAAQNLCPCHVRRRVKSVWRALYRMLEDPEVRVRRAAWHTLEDGGCPDDPALDEIFDRVSQTETDYQVRRFVKDLIAPRKRRESMEINAAGRSLFTQRGKCDFCGQTNAPIKSDFDTQIPTGDGSRLAMICESCETASRR